MIHRVDQQVDFSNDQDVDQQLTNFLDPGIQHIDQSGGGRVRGRGPEEWRTMMLGTISCQKLNKCW